MWAGSGAVDRLGPGAPVSHSGDIVRRQTTVACV
jgi:hypothetical protein